MLENGFIRYHKLNASIIERIREERVFSKRRGQSAFGSKMGEDSQFSFIDGSKRPKGSEKGDRSGDFS